MFCPESIAWFYIKNKKFVLHPFWWYKKDVKSLKNKQYNIHVPGKPISQSIMSLKKKYLWYWYTMYILVLYSIHDFFPHYHNMSIFTCTYDISMLLVCQYY